MFSPPASPPGPKCQQLWLPEPRRCPEVAWVATCQDPSWEICTWSSYCLGVTLDLVRPWSSHCGLGVFHTSRWSSQAGVWLPRAALLGGCRSSGLGDASVKCAGTMHRTTGLFLKRLLVFQKSRWFPFKTQKQKLGYPHPCTHPFGSGAAPPPSPAADFRISAISAICSAVAAHPPRLQLLGGGQNRRSTYSVAGYLPPN